MMTLRYLRSFLPLLSVSFCFFRRYPLSCVLLIRDGNRAGRGGLIVGRVKIGPIFLGQNFNSLALLKNQADRAKYSFGGKKKFGRAGPYQAGPYWPSHTGPSHIGPGQIWPDFFRAYNLMDQPGPNSGRTGLAHRVGPILPPLPLILKLFSLLLMSSVFPLP